MKKLLVVLSIAAAAMTAHANPTVSKDGLVTNKDGRTLYTFDKDTAGKSNCSGGCAAAWPVFTVDNAALADADFSVIKREDGVQQWAYKGKPLYFFAGDSKAGESKGDGSGGVWHALRSNQKAAAASGSWSAYTY